MQTKEDEEVKEILKRVDEVEGYKDDSRRMFQVVKQLQRCKEKKKIIVDGEEGIITDPKNQIKIITEFFNDIFHKNGEKDIQGITPTKMRILFTAEEIKTSINKLKKRKSPGIDILNT